MKLYQIVVAITLTATGAQAQPQQYTVQSGGILREIAMRELSNVEAWCDLCALSNLMDCDLVQAGQVLQLSAGQTGVGRTGATRDTAAVSTPAKTSLAAPVEQIGRAPNIEQNSHLDGAATEVIGSGGSLHDGWSFDGLHGAEIVQTGTKGGHRYIDLRLAGAPVDNAISVTFIIPGNSIEVGPRQTWNLSAYVRWLGGDPTNIDDIFLRVQELDSPDGKGGSGTNFTAELGSRSCAIVTRKICNAAATRLIDLLRIDVSAGDIAMTLRISGPKVEQSDSSGVVRSTWIS